MGDAELKEVLRLQRQADKLYDAGDEEAASKAHKPNLLNTIIWLVETAQQVSAMPAPTSPYISAHLRASPCISLHLPPGERHARQLQGAAMDEGRHREPRPALPSPTRTLLP